MSKYLRCDFAEWKITLNSPHGPFIVVAVISKFFAKFFHFYKFQSPSNCRREKNQPNAELIQPSIEPIELQKRLCQCRRS